MNVQSMAGDRSPVQKKGKITKAGRTQEEQDYLDKILGPAPGNGGEHQFLKKLFWGLILYTLGAPLLAYPISEGLAATLGLISFLTAFFAVVILLSLICGTPKHKEKKFRQEIEEKMLSGEVNVDFFYPGSGESDYLIIDHANGNLWLNTECYKIADIQQVQLTNPGKNCRFFGVVFYFRDITMKPATRFFGPTEGPLADNIFNRVAKELNFS